MPSDLPETMTAIEIPEFGGPEALVPGTRPVPQPAAGEVLIKVAAAGVNFPDVMQRGGNYPPPPGASDIPGLEIAGEIVALGDGVDGWQTGDTACALVAGGGYAEYCAAPAPQCLPIPDGFTMEMAAAIPETFFTVWTNLVDRGRTQPGETVLVHGGSGGIGTAAIQTARVLGATVYATARTAEKCRICEGLGAARAINYAEEDFVEVVMDETNGRGIDVIIDIVGGDYVERNMNALATEGRLVQVAVRDGAKVPVNLFKMMMKRLTITGSTLRARPVAEKGAIADALKQTMLPAFNAGEAKPVMYKTFPLAEASEAHRLMESSDHIGKIVLVP